MPAEPYPDLHALAAAAGVARHWRDVEGRDQTTSDAALAGVLHALGHDTGSSQQIKHSSAALADAARGWPAMLVTQVGLATLLPGSGDDALLTGEDGITQPIAIADGQIAPIAVPGYYRLDIGSRTLTLAVAPSHCPVPAPHSRRMWGTAVQIPALRGAAARAFGSFGELADAAQVLAGNGCDAVAINPVHAMFPGCGTDFSPYSPSSRTFLNTAMGDPALVGLPALASGAGGAFIDWPSALPQRLADLRLLFGGLPPDQRARLLAQPVDNPAALRRHAIFDALDCRFRPHGANGWRDWPTPFHDPDGAAVADYGAANADEVEFHLFAQWLARESLAASQRHARAAGMEIGLITDLAVGVHLSGSDSWAQRGSMLSGLNIGAPPDPLGPQGQNWNITSFSPAGLRAGAYRPWLDMVRAALRSAGGLRIDHAFGLARLWVIPDGEPTARGAYLNFPFLDLVRLLTLEAHRAGALIIAEDLGTAPHGFTAAVASRNMLGMRVLWFERAGDGGFIGAQDYPAGSAAMTGTHDTPTLAGWWSGRDLDWADRLHRLPPGTDRAKAEAARAWDRGLLWSTLTGQSERPAPDNTAPLVTAALAHAARTPSLLVIVPMEDLLGEPEQPNLPGTTHEHPNWQRRLPETTHILLSADPARSNMAVLAARSTQDP
ncbi:4-alpha-glucanotransferase [Sandarakinorhabdus sp.]|uniref:4-alpha-glucanotransferase n=1 Tax=Sandarakinorhabdus sp. TaxID=1916663 RepID=UPI00333E3D1F